MSPLNSLDLTEVPEDFVDNSAKSRAAASGEQFQFISIQNPGEVKGRQNQHRLRSHAAKRALRTKKALQKKEAETVTIQSLGPPLRLLNPSLAFGVASPRLRELLLSSSAKYAAEPVFSLSEEVIFQTYRSVFRVGLTEPALVNAVMLTLVHATEGLRTSREALEYKDKAITSLQSTLGALDLTVLESTMGAILLLAGFEARLGMKSQVEAHMGGISQLLSLSRRWKRHLTDGIKRAVFWQDLNSALLAGSRRIVNHNTFVELRWIRDPCDSTFELGLGFQRVKDLLDDDLVTILEDLHSLQCKRDSASFSCHDVVDLIHVDNQQASIQSRIYNRLVSASLSPLLRCLSMAAYLGATVLCCKVWFVSVIPSFVSRHLLHILHGLENDPTWDRHPGLLFWLLTIGASFSSEGSIRSQYVSLLHAQAAKVRGGAYSSWPKAQQVMKQYIWSDKAIADKMKQFWLEHYSTYFFRDDVLS